MTLKSRTVIANISPGPELVPRLQDESLSGEEADYCSAVYLLLGTPANNCKCRGRALARGEQEDANDRFVWLKAEATRSQSRVWR